MLYLHLVNGTNLVHNFSLYVYLYSLHVSGKYVPIIRRNNYQCDIWYLSLCVDDRLTRRPGVDSASNRNEYQEHFLGVKAAGE
jgi:hypothetical protein